LTQERFDALLAWLSNDRERAGEEYEKIRQGLERYFRFRGCNDPLTMTDETINRLALKLDSLDHSRGHKQITYFYGFASKIFLEYATRTRRELSLEFNVNLPELKNPTENAENESFQCLDKCMGNLRADDRTLLLDYYRLEGREKITYRKEMARRLSESMGAMQTRIYRIRGVLKSCVEKCLDM